MKRGLASEVLATEVLAPAPGQGGKGSKPGRRCACIRPPSRPSPCPAEGAISSRHSRAVVPHHSFLREHRAPPGAWDAHEETFRCIPSSFHSANGAGPFITALSAIPALSQNVGSFLDASKGVVDCRQKVAESKEECAALGRLVPTVEGARLTVLNSVAVQAAQGVPDFCRVVAVIDPEVPGDAATP